MRDARRDATSARGVAQLASRSVDHAIARLAASRYGVVERGQLVAATIATALTTPQRPP